MNTARATRSDVTIVLLIFIALAAFGVAGAGFVVRDYAKARASAGWPVYEGIVLSRHGGSNAMRYVYSVDGRSYESSRWRFFSARFLSGERPSFGPGETVDVYVDPRDHAVSVLQPGGASAFFAIASVLFGACIFFGVGGIVRVLTLTAEPDPA